MLQRLQKCLHIKKAVNYCGFQMEVIHIKTCNQFVDLLDVEGTHGGTMTSFCACEAALQVYTHDFGAGIFSEMSGGRMDLGLPVMYAITQITERNCNYNVGQIADKDVNRVDVDFEKEFLVSSSSDDGQQYYAFSEELWPILKRFLQHRNWCENCGRAQTRARNLHECTACHSVSYCDKTCQKKHWREHKKACKK